MTRKEMQTKIEALEDMLLTQMNNNKILNQRNKNLQEEVIKYQKKVIEGKEIIQNLLNNK